MASPVQGTVQGRLPGNRRPTNGATPSSSRRPRPVTMECGSRRAKLSALSADTRTVLPDILKQLPELHAAKSEAMLLYSTPPLKASDCPKRTASSKTTIRIVNEDTFNAAISLASSRGPGSGRVAVLNMASHAHPGGGWLRGALAQEEALCYRSSLHLSLHRRYYPWKQRMGLYTPDVVIIRSDMASGHKLLMPDVAAQDLPVVSVLSIAALCRPHTKTTLEHALDGSKAIQREIYADPAARTLTKEKMRLCLRMAGSRGHGLLVLGALGCGAFGNPREEVARCWLEVLREVEFQGGWWEEVVFAVFDARNEGNFEAFEQILGGIEV